VDTIRFWNKPYLRVTIEDSQQKEFVLALRAACCCPQSPRRCVQSIITAFRSTLQSG
jgi:hypothetical protein